MSFENKQTGKFSRAGAQENFSDRKDIQGAASRLPIKREISAGIIVYRKTEEGIKFLILYHGHSYWNFPKGKIESEEKSLQAALRETREETGLMPRELKLSDTFRAHERFYFRRAGQSVYKIVIFYLAETMSNRITLSEEHNGYGWFSFEEARRILGKYRDSQRVLKQVDDFLKGRRPKQVPQKNTTHPAQPSHHPSTPRYAIIPRRSTRTYRAGSAWQGNNVRRDRPSHR